MRVPLRTIAALPIANGIGESATLGAPDWPRYIRTTDIASLDALDDTRRATLPPNVAATAMLAAGDILMCAAGSVGVAHQWQGNEPACFAGYLVRLRVNERVASARFVAWWTQSSDFLNQVYAGAVRSTIDNYSAGKYRATTLPLPSLSAQIAIASYLDEETTEIDEFIADQKQLIALLEERSATYVAGHIPSAPRAPLARVMREITDGAHISPDTDGGTELFVSTRDVSADGVIDLEGCLRTTRSTYDYMVKTSCQPLAGDLLFSKDGTVGRTAVVPNTVPFVVASSLVIMRPGYRVRSSYVNYALRNPSVLFTIGALVKGAGLPRISVANVGRLEISVPPIEEQDAIVRRLDAETSSIAAAIADARRAIALSKERRAALISAAVTGRIDVTERKRVLV